MDAFAGVDVATLLTVVYVVVFLSDIAEHQ